jgi:hypothetical protein
MKRPYTESETNCCKKFNPDPWDQREVTLADKLFLHDTVRTLFHIPLNFGQVISRAMKAIEKHEACTEETITLYEEAGPFKAHLYVSARKQIPGARMVKMDGTFITRVFEGDYRNMGAWHRKMQEYVKSKSKNAKKTLVYYTTCPRCAQYYKKNYVVFLARVGE